MWFSLLDTQTFPGLWAFMAYLLMISYIFLIIPWGLIYIRAHYLLPVSPYDIALLPHLSYYFTQIQCSLITPALWARVRYYSAQLSATQSPIGSHRFQEEKSKVTGTTGGGNGHTKPGLSLSLTTSPSHTYSPPFPHSRSKTLSWNIGRRTGNPLPTQIPAITGVPLRSPQIPHPSLHGPLGFLRRTTGKRRVQHSNSSLATHLPGTTHESSTRQPPTHALAPTLIVKVACGPFVTTSRIARSMI